MSRSVNMKYGVKSVQAYSSHKHLICVASGSSGEAPTSDCAVLTVSQSTAHYGLTPAKTQSQGEHRAVRILYLSTSQLGMIGQCH